MNYDITMCANEHCSQKVTCNRWLTYQHYQNDKDTNKRTYVSMNLYNKEVSECPLLWRVNKQEIQNQ